MNVETLKDRYDNERISLALLKLYVKKGVITEDQYYTITNKAYES